MTGDIDTRPRGPSFNTLSVPWGLEGGLLESECARQAAAREEVQGPAPHSAGYRLTPVQQDLTLQVGLFSQILYLHEAGFVFVYFFKKYFSGIIAMPCSLSNH